MTTERLEERGHGLAVLLAARVSGEQRRLDAEVRSGRRREWDVEAPAAGTAPS